jgi:hypothetical protein
MDISHDLYAAIGVVVVEATKLEYAVAQLITARWGWNDHQELAMVAKNGVLRRQFCQLVEADPSWRSAQKLQRDTFAVLDDRHRLVHSVVVHIVDDDGETHAIQMWNANSGAKVPLPSVAAVQEHAFDIGRCFTAAVMLIPDASTRFEELGAANAPKPPNTDQADGLAEPDGLETA